MNKIEKLKISVEVALYYFTIHTIFYILSLFIPILLIRGGTELVVTLRAYAPYYISLTVVIILLVIILNLVKRKQHGRISIDSKPLVFIIVGLLLIVTGVTQISTYVPIIRTYLGLLSQNKDSSLINGILRAIVPIVIYAVQIASGAYLIFIAIKKDIQIEKIKVAVDVTLYYFIITTVSLQLFNIISSDLFFRGSGNLFAEFKRNILFYAVLVVVILCLAVLSNILRKRAPGRLSIDSKPLVYIIVGVLLIITGLTEIPTEVVRLYSYSHILVGISQIQKTEYFNTIYMAAIAHIMFYAIQSGIGAYFAFKTFTRDKHIEEVHLG